MLDATSMLASLGTILLTVFILSLGRNLFGLRGRTQAMPLKPNSAARLRNNDSANDSRIKVGIVGGGLSGLVLAHRLLQYDAVAEVTILEASPRLGGWAHSLVSDDGQFLFESGPRSFRTAGANGTRMLQLVGDLDLAEEAVGTSPVAAARYIFLKDKLVKLPMSLVGIFTSKLTYKLPWNILKGMVAPPVCREDITIHEFVAAQAGHEAAENLAAAMVNGIFAGDARRLSIQSCMPAVLSMATNGGGSLGRGMFGGPRQPKFEGKLGQLQRSSSLSFRRGLGTLVDALKNSFAKYPGRVEIHHNAPVDKILKNGGRIEVFSTSHGSGNPVKWGFDHVFSTVGSTALASALPSGPTQTALASVVADVASITVVAIGFEDLPAPFPGFGHLCPEVSDLGVLGVIYDSENFPTQRPPSDGQTLPMLRLSVMMGGTRMPWVMEKSDEEVAVLACQALKLQLGIDKEPSCLRILRHRDCIPQYYVGHRTLVNEAEKLCASEFEGKLTFLGTSFYGVGIPDNVARAQDAADALFESVV